MDSRERVLAALSGEETDRTPVAIFTQSATIGGMEATGAYWPEAHSDPRKMATLGCAQATVFGFPTARVPFDINAEAERLGCGVNYGSKSEFPWIESRAFTIDVSENLYPEPDDLPSPSEFLEGRRIQIIAEAIGICRKEHPELVVTGGLLGPVGLLGQQVSVEEIIMSSLTNPDWVERWCSALTPLIAAYARLQEDMGADVVTIVESGSSEHIIDPCYYNKFSGQFIPKILPKNAKSVLHICGETGKLLPEIARTGADAFSPDQIMDPDMVVAAMSGKMATVGAVDPIITLLQGTPERVVSEARMFESKGFDVVAPACGLPPEIPDRNMLALSGALSD